MVPACCPRVHLCSSCDPSECLQQLDEYCDFGKFKDYIISPSYVRSFYSKEPNVQPPPLETIPLVQTASTPVETEPHTLRRSMSDHVESSSPIADLFAPMDPLLDSNDDEIRYRKSRGSFDDDSVGGSPPPNLTEYKPREDSTQLDLDEKEIVRTRKFSWQSMFSDIK